MATGAAARHERERDRYDGRRPSDAKYVAPREADYHRAAVVHGVDVRCLLAEVFGGFGPELEQLIDELARERQDKLNRNEYDETTWSARTWKTFTRQKLSVALHRAVATELVQALGLSHVADTRD